MKLFDVPHQYQDTLVIALRVSLGLIFVWFGVLKIFGYNPVYDLIYGSFPIFAEGAGLIVLGVMETAIGIGLLSNLLPLLTHLALVAHLAGTFITFVSAPEIMFQPYFPILTLSGEFVFKNTTLAIAGLVVLGYHHPKK